MHNKTMSNSSGPTGLHPFHSGLTGATSLALLLAGSLWTSACGDSASTPDAGEVADASTIVDASLPDATVPDAACVTGVAVAYTGNTLPAEIAGFYNEAFDCVNEEGGADFGNIMSSHCFRKSDDSAWRIWNTGCGWEIGRHELVDPGNSEETEWQRHARSYSGNCSTIPPIQLTVEALTTDTFYDGFGTLITGVSAVREDCLP